MAAGVALHFGVGYPYMIYAGQFVFKHLTDTCDVAKCEVAVIELLLFYFAVYNVVDQTVHCFFVVVFQALAGGLDAVDDHDDGGFGGEGSGACVAESRGVDWFAGVGFFLLGVEVACVGGAVVGADEVDDGAREVVLAGEVDAIGDVLCDDAGAFFVVELVVRVEVAALVLGEVERGVHLADVVIEGSDACEEWVAADFTDDVFADVGDLHGVLEGAWGVA